MGVIAVAVGMTLGIDPFADFRWEWRALLAGIAATAPMLAGFLAVWRSEAAFARRLRARVDSAVRTLFARSSLLEIALVCLAAGIGEEALFRGLIQGGLEQQFGPASALWGAAAIFGLAHPVTRAYVFVAAVAGYFLGWLWQVSDNLLAPITAHALYDLMVLLILIRDQRWND